MKLRLTIIICGGAAMAAQLLFARELMVVSLGSELAIGLVFFSWLFWVGVGSAAGGCYIRKKKSGDSSVAAVMIAIGILIPLSLIWIRLQSSLFGFQHGELIPVDTALAMSLIALAPLCLVVGFSFPVFCAVAERECQKSAASKMYALDTLGAVAGGLSFSLFLIMWIGPGACALVFGTVSVFTGSAWLSRRVRLVVWMLLAVGAAASPLWFGMAGLTTRALSWGGTPALSVESGYGNITVLKDAEQFSFFSNGRLAGSTPDIVFGDFMANIPLLAHPAPKKALLIGGEAVTIREMLKHGLSEIVFLELDPEMIEMKRKFATPELRKYYSDPRVKIVAGDPRRYIATWPFKKYDVIIIDAGSPETIQINRYFTCEFLQLVSKSLEQEGIAAFTIPLSENYMGSEKSALVGSLIATFLHATDTRTNKKTISAGRLLPIFGPKTILLWKPDGDIAESSDDAAGRYISRGIISNNFSSDLAAYYFDRTRIENTLAPFSKNPLDFAVSPNRISSALVDIAEAPGVRINRDSDPVCVYQYSRFISVFYHSKAGAIMNEFARIVTFLNHRNRIIFLLAGMSLFFIIFGFVGKSGENTGGKVIVFTTAAAAGLTGMFIEILLLLKFQTTFGVVYQYLGLITAAYMGGSVAGSWMAGRQRESVNSYTQLFIFALLCLKLSIVSFSPSFSGAFGNSVTFGNQSYLLASVFIFIASILAGLSVGILFTLTVNQMKRLTGNEAFSAGIIYFADLSGACLCALTSSTVVIPVAGMFNSYKFTQALIIFIVIIFTLATFFTYRIKNAKVQD